GPDWLCFCGLSEEEGPPMSNVYDAVTNGDLSLLERTLKGSDVNAVNSSGETLLHVAAANGHVPVIEFLITKGAKIDAKDVKKRTPLHRAAENGHLEAVRVLLKAGANMYCLDSDNQTPVHLAAQNNHQEVLKTFLKEEGTLYKNRLNILHMAATVDDSELAQLLLKNGASVDATDEKKQTPLFHAVSGGHEATVKIFGLLLEYSKGLSPDTMISAMFKAVKLNLCGIIKALINKGTDVNATNDMEYTPLLLAAELGKLEAAQAVIEKEARLDIRTPNLNTALHLAVQRGDESVTPLHIASQRGNLDVAKCLLRHKANVNTKDKLSKTPLHLAVEGGGTAMVELLLNNNADANVADKDKKMPLHFAAALGEVEMSRQFAKSWRIACTYGACSVPVRGQ
uniref:Ankyrin 1 n=1 Tax=Leptobrachium leishanense TaxID=445787 RepID=A0A8C5WKU1_9ANUR